MHHIQISERLADNIFSVAEKLNLVSCGSIVLQSTHPKGSWSCKNALLIENMKWKMNYREKENYSHIFVVTFIDSCLLHL